jgi:hypothetical protein
VLQRFKLLYVCDFFPYFPLPSLFSVLIPLHLPSHFFLIFFPFLPFYFSFPIVVFAIAIASLSLHLVISLRVSMSHLVISLCALFCHALVLRFVLYYVVLSSRFISYLGALP